MRVLTPGLVGLMFLFACSSTPSDRDGAVSDATSDSATTDGGTTPDGSTADGTATDGTTTDGTATSDGSTADGPVSPPGFTTEPGFTVTGSLVHGGSVTIKHTAGGLGSRPHPLPWLWDLVSAQYLNGVDQKAYAGVGDGQPVTTAVWTNQNLYQGWDLPEHKFKYTTSRPLRHPRATAQYGNYAKSPTDPKPYSKLAFPKWPSAWGTQTNARMYLSWWQRLNGATPGYPQDAQGNGGEDKPLRFGDSFSAGLGMFDITVAGLTVNTVGFGNVKAWGSLPDPKAAWHRIELFIDRTVGIADMYVDGKLRLGTAWSVNKNDLFEFRPKAQYLYASPAVAGTELDTASWKNVTVHWLGFDDGGMTTKFAPGRNVEVSEIYLDVSRARVELSSAATWQHRPDAVRTSEVQGRLTAWSASTVQFQLHQGAFGSLAGLYLWVITDAGQALKVGRFAP